MIPEDVKEGERRLIDGGGNVLSRTSTPLNAVGRAAFAVSSRESLPAIAGWASRDAIEAFDVVGENGLSSPSSDGTPPTTAIFRP